MGSIGFQPAGVVRRSLLIMSWQALLVSTGLMVSASAMALADAARFDIPPQPLPAALKAFAAQAHMQLLYKYSVVATAKGNAVSGDLDKHAALEALLRNTGLEAVYSSDNAAAIRPIKLSVQASGKSDDPSDKEGKKSSSGGFRVAQVDQGQTSRRSTVEKQDDQAPKKKPVYLEEVIVTGSRIPTAAGQQVLPVRSYSKEDIERSGQTTVADFLNILPDVSTSSAVNGFTYNGTAGQTTVSLHGLPVGTTLTLLNGRRVETDDAGFFNLNSIPVSAVERIEVLPVGASAVYGADALGGAVNIILRKDLNGLEFNGTAGHAAAVNDVSFNLGWGKSWERASISFIGGYQKAGELLGTDRPAIFSVSRSLPVTAFFLDMCSPGNVYSLNGQNLPGLSSPQAGIPTGISGTPTPSQFAVTAGKKNECNIYQNYGFLPDAHREGALLTGHYQVAESMDLFVEVLASHEEQIAQGLPVIMVYGGSLGLFKLGANNPYNPFGEAVGVSFENSSIKGGYDNRDSLVRPLIGVRGSVFSDWNYEATAYFSHDLFQPEFLSFNASALQAALNSSDPATALNPFTTGTPGTPQALQSLGALSRNQNWRHTNQIIDGQAVLRGPLLHLPAGSVEAVIGGEYNQQKQFTATPDSTPPTNPHRDAYAVFTEARIPLVAASEHPQTGDRLTLTVAGRYDHSNDFGGKATWQGGLLWRPTATLLLRGGYGLSYRAPALREISGLVITDTLDNFGYALTDPFRGGASVPGQSLVAFGANPNLKAETGNSRTVGIVYTSEALRGFQAALTYFGVNISNYIAAPDAQIIVNNPNLYPGGAIRGPATPQDQQNGYLGPITQVNQLYYNFGDLHVDGFDADVRCAIDTGVGQLTPSLAIANIYTWQSALVPGAALVSYLGQAGGNPGWAPRWKGTAALAWKRGPLLAGFAGRYVGRYTDSQAFGPNSNELGNSWFVDANVRYEVGNAWPGAYPWLAGTHIALGVVNLFDKSPPASRVPPSYDPHEYDPRGRYIYAQLGVKW